MQFFFQPLTWGFLLIGVPILVHLINMLRHSRQRWAAMDFLLESYRRNRRWVMLKQWLLLAARILVMFLLVTMLARWVSSAQWLSWFGGQTTHHYVLVDDSFSMREQDQQVTPYVRALQALGGLVRSIGLRPGQHQITLIRMSRASLALRSGDDQTGVEAAADLLAQSVPREPARLLDRLNATAPVSMRLSPEQGLELITPLVERNADQRNEVYLLTDLRRIDFGQAEALSNRLRSLNAAGATVHLIDCAHDLSGRNLSIVSLTPEQGVWAAGVPLMVRVQVRNRGLQAVNNVVLRVRVINYPPGTVMKSQMNQPYSGQVSDLPPLVIDRIQPGETVARQVQVVFTLPGHHVVEAALPDDVLADDNRRWCTVAVKESQRVLAIDGSVERKNAFYLEKVLRPGNQLKTGMEIETHDAGFLRDVAPDVLATFDSIALLDVPRLDPQAVDKLIAFCEQGGGVLILAGPNSNLQVINQDWYRDGKGLFPVPVAGIDEIQIPATEQQPQVVATEHTILEPLTRLKSSPFQLLQIRKMLRVNLDSGNQRGIEVVAFGPNRRPLILDSPLGEGRVVTLLTGLDLSWSNWVQDPTFVVLVLRSLGYVSSFRRPPTSHAVGEPVEWVIVGEQVLPQAEVIVPGGVNGTSVRIQREVEMLEQGAAQVRIAPSLSQDQRELVDLLLRPGVFEVWVATARGESLVRCFAHDVSAAEGDLSRVGASELERSLAGIDYTLQSAESLAAATAAAEESAHDLALIVLLGLLLLGEQALAYSASYHPLPATASKGGLP